MSDSVPTDHEPGIDDVDKPLPKIPPGTGDVSTIPSSPCNVTAPDTSDKSLPPSETSEEPRDCHWTLRPSTCRKRNTDIAWYDHDQSGTYDPLEEAKRLRPKKKAKASGREHREDNDEHGTTNAVLGIVTKSKPVLEVRLRFQSSSARTTFSQMCADQQSKAQTAPDHFSEGYQLRKRESAAEPEPLDAPGTRVTTLRNSPFSLPDDLSNRPAARGCYGCLAMGLNCSLLEFEHEWPCHDCKENEDDCQLVTVCFYDAHHDSTFSHGLGTDPETGLHTLPVSRENAEVESLLLRLRAGCFRASWTMQAMPRRWPPALYRGSSPWRDTHSNKDQMGRGKLCATHKSAHPRTQELQNRHMSAMPGSSSPVLVCIQKFRG